MTAASTLLLLRTAPRRASAVASLTRVFFAPMSSTASAAAETPAPPRRRLRDLPPPLKLVRCGCNGLSYTMNYAEKKEMLEEEVCEKGVRVFVEPKALFHVVGTTMDFQTTPVSAEF
ncbi:hypothetical protein PybrP1_012456 [[Pythium] brassicae (nom. inval.)]|nr:hypothetical protein PybrP1_012456 [[Pythium] brassicae (nom. inval.)]